MGWMKMLDENNEIGIVGDEAWDKASIILDNLLKELNEIYQRNFNRDITKSEFESVVEFSMPIWDEGRR